MSRLHFQAELQASVLADTGIIMLQNSAMVVAHTTRHISHASNDDLFVYRQVAGRFVCEQQGRDVVLEAGDFTLVEPRVPCNGEFSAGSKLLILRIPRRLLEARIGSAREMAAHVIRPATDGNSFTSELLAMLPSHVNGLDALARTAVENQVLDLIAISLSKAIRGNRPRISSARSLALMKLRFEIEQQLTNQAADAASIAGAAGISVRYANALLADEDTSITRLVWTRRLERCRRALEDPLQAQRSVSEVASGWGFSDMTHFGRRFKAAYGASPREYRYATQARDGS
jgi:AraC-like DNA-binding protein